MSQVGDLIKLHIKKILFFNIKNKQQHQQQKQTIAKIKSFANNILSLSHSVLYLFCYICLRLSVCLSSCLSDCLSYCVSVHLSVITLICTAILLMSPSFCLNCFCRCARVLSSDPCKLVRASRSSFSARSWFLRSAMRPSHSRSCDLRRWRMREENAVMSNYLKIVSIKKNYLRQINGNRNIVLYQT